MGIFSKELPWRVVQQFISEDDPCLFRRVIQQFASKGCPIEFYRKIGIMFSRTKKPFVLKIVFLTLGLGMREGVSEGSRYGDGCITFSSITCRHLSRDLYVLLECLVFHCMNT